MVGRPMLGCAAEITDVSEPVVDCLIAPDLHGERLDRAIARLNPRISRMEARRMIGGGSVFVDQHRTRIASRLVRAGQRLVCYRLALAPSGSAPRVVLAHADFLVVDKPAGMAVEPTRAGDVATVTRWLSEQGQPAFITHRLDVPVSGALVVATTAAAQAELNRLFAVHGVERQYLAAVTPAPSWQTETIDSPLDDQPARTFARVCQRAGDAAALLEVQLETGRFRQIRRHLAAAGFPVAGDRDARAAAPAARILLHAFRLAFTWHGESIDVPVPPGDDFSAALATLGIALPPPAAPR
jgi:23S rRNA-/tRNA-specific pseudouridylate synthase